MTQVFVEFFNMISELNWFLQWCALWLIWGPLSIVYMIVKTPFLIYNRTMRHLNIRHNGWPPSHLNADGDWKKENE